MLRKLVGILSASPPKKKPGPHSRVSVRQKSLRLYYSHIVSVINSVWPAESPRMGLPQCCVLFDPSNMNVSINAALAPAGHSATAFSRFTCDNTPLNRAGTELNSLSARTIISRRRALLGHIRPFAPLGKCGNGHLIKRLSFSGMIAGSLPFVITPSRYTTPIHTLVLDVHCFVILR